jgi:chromate reductase
MKIAVIVGSLRKESFNRKVANVLVSLAPKTLAMEFVEIGDLALFNEDLEDAPPASWTKFQEKITSVDGILFVTPEYNRSVPGVLKNAIDIGSRESTFSKNAWSGKVGAVATASPGTAGGTNGHHHLRQSLMAVNVAVMPQPEVCLSRVHELFDANGLLLNEKTKAFLQKFMAEFAAWALTIKSD